MKQLIIGTSVLAMVAATPVLAQDQQGSNTQATQGQQAQQNNGNDQVVVLNDWSYDPIYSDGWSVERVLDNATLIGADGDEIGNVENVVFSDGGKALALIAEVGGFWDIGDTNVSIPWDEVQLSSDVSRVTVPVTEDTVDDYSLFGKKSTIRKDQVGTTTVVEEEPGTGQNTFKATDLIGDFAYLSDNAPYGYVNDLVVKDGEINAVVVDAGTAGDRDYYAYPYNGYGVRQPAPSRYTMPYTRDQITVLQNFDYDRMKRAPSGADTGTTSSTTSDGGNTQNQGNSSTTK